MKTQAEYQDLLQRVLKWSRRLGLDYASNPRQQSLKMIEEMGELARGIQKYDTLAIMDGLGDVLVVATVALSQVHKGSLELGSVSCDKDTIIDKYLAFNKLNISVFSHIQTCIEVNLVGKARFDYKLTLLGVLHSAKKLAECLGLDWVQCLKMAYTTIHFRSGEIVDGVFVKRDLQATITLPVGILSYDIDNIIKTVYDYANDNKISFFKINFDEIETISHK